MPRNVRDSDDEIEAKSSSGRRMRAALNPSVLDSPLRRSTRIKHPVHQEGSSPESVSDVPARSNRRRTATGDSGIADSARSLRTRRNSVASDISELTETESLPDGPAKRRSTRRSIAAVETPPSLNGRPRRATRAGSESKSTPPVGRTTRRNRATSLEPEGIEEQKVREVGTPAKSRRRASVLPSEPALAEESEDSGRGSRRQVDKTVYEIDEDESDSGHNTSRSSRRKSKSDTTPSSPEKMEVDEAPVEESEGNTRENTEPGAPEISHSPRRSPEESVAEATGGSSPTISLARDDELGRPSTEKQEKSPGNKENETLNSSAKSTRLSGRRSLNSHEKSQEKRRSVTSDVGSAGNGETPTKTPQESRADSANKSTEKSNRRERFSVDDCVVIIEPMEIDRVEIIAVGGGASTTRETPKPTPTSPEVTKSPSEITQVEVTYEESSGEQAAEISGGNVVVEEVADEDSELMITNVVSIAANKHEEGQKKGGETGSVEIVEISEDLRAGIEDAAAAENESQPMIESPNDEKDSPKEIPGSIVQPEIAISNEDKETITENANDEEESALRLAESDAEIVGRATEDETNDEEMSEGTSIEIVEIAVPNSEGNSCSSSSDVANDDQTSTVTPAAIVEPTASNSEEKTPDVAASDDSSSMETSTSRVRAPASDSEEKTPDVTANDDKSSMETFASHVGASVSSPEEKADGDVEASSTEAASVIFETAGFSSIDNEMPTNSGEIEDCLVFSKGRKSSIVTESPTSGANGEEAPSVREEEKEEEEEARDEKRRKSASDSRQSSDAAESKSRENEETDEKRRKSAANGRSSDANESRNCENEEVERKTRQSDEESDLDGYPTFKDITADEWKPNREGETNSLHSASTERNESDCDLELVMNDAPRQSRGKETTEEDDEEEKETPMDVERNGDEEKAIAPNKNASPAAGVSRRKSLQVDQPANDTSNSWTKKRSVNGGPRPREEADSGGDDDDDGGSDVSTLVEACGKKSENRPLDTSVKDSPVASKRKSLQLDDSANSSAKLKSSAKKRSLTARDRRREDADSDDEPEAAESSDVSSPKTSGGKTTDRSSVSKANSPTNGERRSTEASAKRDRSLDISADDAADFSGDSAESEVGKRAKAKSLHAELMQQLKGRMSNGNAGKSPASPKIERSAKIGSARQSPNEKNRSRLTVAESESDDEIAESPKSAGSKTIAINLDNSTYGKSCDPVIAFQDSPASPDNLEPAIVDYRDSPQSPEPEDRAPAKSVKIVAVKRSAGKNKAQASPVNSDTEIEAADDQESTGSPESVKIGSAKKSANKNASKLAADSEDNDGGGESPRKSKKSSKIGSAKKSTNTTISLNSSDSAPDDEEPLRSPEKSSRSASARKSAIDRNYSTIAQINSDSDGDKDVESSDSSADVSRKIPKFLYDHDSDDDDDDDSSRSIDSDVARDLNLDGKGSSMLQYSDDDVPADDCVATESESSDDDDDGADLIDFVVDDDDDEDDDEDVAVDLGLEDEDEDESPDSSPEAEKPNPRKRIIPRPAGASDSDESDEQEATIVSPAKSAAKTPMKSPKPNKSLETVDDESKSADLNLSAKNLAARKKNLLIQSSTPKTLARQSLLREKPDSPKATTPTNKSLKSTDSPMKLTTPANKSLKSADSSTKIDRETSRRLSKSVCETIETPVKLGSSFKLAKTPKSSPAAQLQLQTSLPIDLNETAEKINLSKAKSTKISTLNQTVAPIGSESPETRFLMKEKLNDSMPALKVQQRARALRLSVLDNLREKKDLDDEIREENDDNEVSTEMSAEKRADDDAEPEVAGETKKKNKKKKKKRISESSNAAPNHEEENVAALPETSAKKARKLSGKKKPEEANHEKVPRTKRNKMNETIELDEPIETEKLERKKKKKQQQQQQKMPETAEEHAPIETEKLEKRKKKKQRKSSENTEPEARKKSRRLAAQPKETDSDDAPEAVDFTVARDAAIRDFKRMTESIKTARDAGRKKRPENLVSRPVVAKTSVKRLPDDILANLSAVAERPKKRRKVARDEEKPRIIALGPLPTKSGVFSVDEGDIPLSTTGGTTQFSVVNLKKAVKHSKKAAAAMTFRERMLARNPRQPVSAYMMYLQKQKVSGKDRQY